MATVWVDDVTHLVPLVLTVGEGKVVRWEGNSGKGSWLVSINIWVVVFYLGLGSSKMNVHMFSFKASSCCLVASREIGRIILVAWKRATVNPNANK